MTLENKKEIPLNSNTERRKARRRPILETFSIFIAVPKKGIHRLTVHDISEEGIGFDLDIEGESFSDFPIAEKELIDLRFYLNPSLFIPLGVQVVRVVKSPQVRRIGAEFKDRSLKNYKALLSFLAFIDEVSTISPTNSE